MTYPEFLRPQVRRIHPHCSCFDSFAKKFLASIAGLNITEVFKNCEYIVLAPIADCLVDPASSPKIGNSPVLRPATSEDGNEDVAEGMWIIHQQILLIEPLLQSWTTKRAPASGSGVCLSALPLPWLGSTYSRSPAPVRMSYPYVSPKWVQNPTWPIYRSPLSSRIKLR
jgi:hypothetical protein